MNKRRVFIYALLLALLVGSVPYLAGFLVENRFRETMAFYHELNPGIQVKVTEYQRGWARSHAKTRLIIKKQALEGVGGALASPKLSGKGVAVTFEHDIRHGPFVPKKAGQWRDWEFALALIESKLMLKDAAKEILTVEFEPAELLTFQSEIHIDGSVTMQLAGEPLKIKNDAPNRVAWQGLEGKWHINDDYDEVKGALTFPGFDLDMNGYRAVLKSLQIHSDYSKVNDTLWLGKSGFDLSQFHLIDSDNEKHQLGVNGMALLAQAELGKNQLIQSALGVRIKQFGFSQDELGPLNVVFRVTNLSPEFVTKAQSVLGQTTVINPVMMMGLMTLVPDLVKTRPAFILDDFRLKTQEGHVKAKFNLSFNEGAANVMAISQFIRSINASASASFPKQWLVNTYHGIDKHYAKPDANIEPYQTQVDKAIEKGYITEKNGQCTIELRLENGILTINDVKLVLAN